jgi:hypothetical protein
MDVAWSQAIGTIFVGFAGLWLAYSYRRQARLKLAERQVDSYQELWRLTARATPERDTPLSPDERQTIYDDMILWYYEHGNGIFASAKTRDVFIGVRSNLVCPTRSIRPTALATELVELSDAQAERRRGCVSIRQASLLRMQLKTDLNLHFGFTYYSHLRPDDRAFLRSCGLSAWRRPWRARLFHRSGRGGPNPCVCGLCGTAPTPMSDRPHA